MKKRFQCEIKISWLWLIIWFVYVLNFDKIWLYLYGIIFMHECSHLIVALVHHYRIRSICIYPFGLSCDIINFGYGDLFAEFLIVCAGVVAQGFVPIILYGFVLLHLISLGFYKYLCKMNLFLIIFNLLPIYPLDGGRLIQIFFHKIFPYKQAQLYTLYWSCIFLFVVFLLINKTVSFYCVCLYLVYEWIVMYRMRFLDCIRFYRYRFEYEYHGRIKIHQKNDLYRGYKNVLIDGLNIVCEKEWLRRFFYQ